MPKIEAKVIQKELESGKVRPVYYIFGPERMKSRELLKRVQRTVLADEKPNDFNYERIDGADVSMESILDSAQSFSMMGGTKLIVVRNAEDIKDQEALVAYLKEMPNTEPGPAADLTCVTVFLAKGFDGRKKTSKAIQDLGAVVACEEVADQDREPWIDYLAKRRGFTLSPSERLVLRGLDPWSLDLVDSEISKLELLVNHEDLRAQVLMSGVDSYARDEFIDSLFSRDARRAFQYIHLFSEEMEVQLPVLGLIAWNLRQLKQFILETTTRSRGAKKPNPYLLRNLERWAKHWNLESITKLERGLFDIDFSLKNTRLLGRGLWTNLFLETA
jgi:DNA polymerase-3 subunit delta